MEVVATTEERIGKTSARESENNALESLLRPLFFIGRHDSLAQFVIRNMNPVTANAVAGYFCLKGVLTMAEIIAKIVYVIVLIIEEIKGGKNNA